MRTMAKDISPCHDGHFMLGHITIFHSRKRYSASLSGSSTSIKRVRKHFGPSLPVATSRYRTVPTRLNPSKRGLDGEKGFSKLFLIRLSLGPPRFVLETYTESFLWPRLGLPLGGGFFPRVQRFLKNPDILPVYTMAETKTKSQGAGTQIFDQCIYKD